MGIEASYRRITPAQWEEVQGLVVTDDSPAGYSSEEAYVEFAYSDEFMSSDRFLSIEKEWHALHALLTGDLRVPDVSSPLAIEHSPLLGNVVMGGAETQFDATYGKVRILAPDEVRQVADALGKITADDLKARFDPVAFAEAGIYPIGAASRWAEEDLGVLLFFYPQLVDFFGKAAREGNIVLLSFD